MNRSWALSPWLQVPFGLAFLLFGLASPWVFVDGLHADALVRADRVCPSGTTIGAEDCLVPVEGRVTDQRGRTSKRYRFEPLDRRLDDEWVRFPGDETRQPGSMATLLSGGPATALYADDSVVAFEVDGERVVEMSGEPGAARRTLWIGLAFGCLGLMALVGVWSRHRADRPLRRGWDDLAPGTPQPERRPAAAGVLSLVLLSVALGGFGAFFAGSLRAELVTFAAVAGPFGTWLWWARGRALRRTSPGSATAA